MKHQSTRTVFDYWNKKRGMRSAPARAEINPGEIRHALMDTFMLAADFVDQLRFRLAGTRACALFDREIKGEAFVELWDDGSRDAVEDLLNIVTTETAAVVAGVTARTDDGSTADVEMLLLPLAHVGHTRIRIMGVLAPATPPWWLGVKPVTALTLGTVRHTGADADISLAPRMITGIHARHGLVVYSGGRDAGEHTG